MNNLFSAVLPALFQAVLVMSLTAAATALAVLLIRAVMRMLEVPRAIVFLLWAVVLFRMVCPVSFSSSWSLLSLFPAAEEQVADFSDGDLSGNQVIWDSPQSHERYQAGVSGGGIVVSPAPEDGGGSYVVTGPDGASPPATVETDVLPVLSVIWALGVLALWLWSLLSWLRLRLKLSAAVRTPDGAWESDRVDSPFVLGFFPPKIYLPLGLTGDTRRYVLLHGRSHIRRVDHIVKVLAFLALAVHWFNPLLWVSWFLSCRDMEAACDESVLRRSPEDIRKSYSAALLSLAVAHPLRVPLAFGENDVKGRVKGALRWKRPAAALVAVALVFGLAAGYGVVRSTVLDKLKEAEAQVARLTAAQDAQAQASGYDAFEEEVTGENRAALSELAGEAFEAEDAANALMSEDDLSGGAAAQAADAPVVVAEYAGGQLMSDEVAREYETQAAGYLFAGYSEDEIADVLLDEVLRYMVSDRVVEAHAREMGLYELTDADNARIDAEAAEHYNAELDFYRAYVNTEGMTEEEAVGAVKSYLLETEGESYETVRADVAAGWWMQKVYDAVTKDVRVDDADVQAAYDARLAEQKESFGAYTDDYEFAQMSGEIITYNLSGYRGVKLLLFGLEDAAAEAAAELEEEIAALDPEADAEEIAEYQAQLDACYASAQAEAQSALEALARGADFDALIEEMGDDEGMRDARLRAKGYYISADSLLWPPEIISAAMALEQPGDCSGAVRMGDGVAVLQYVGEVPAGEVPLADVRDAIEADALEEARCEAYEAQVNAWLEEADVRYYPERMQ